MPNATGAHYDSISEIPMTLAPGANDDGRER